MKTALILAAVVLVSFSPGKKNCLSRSEELYRISQLPSVSDSLLLRSRYLVDKIDGRCVENGVLVVRGDQIISVGSLASVFGTLCGKCKSNNGAQAFIEFRRDQWASADEDLALSLERIFVSRPAFVMAYMHQFSDTVRTQMLNDIVWGFINNRLYGPEDPRENGISEPYGMVGERPREKLNKYTCKQIFFRLNPAMTSVAESYPREINYMLEQARNYFETWGDSQ